MTTLMLRMRAWGFGLLAAVALSACGGGGSASPAPTAIPESLAITGPSTAESATAMEFGNSAGTLAGLKYQWDFGDGSGSTEAAPSHSFASGGEFEVMLKVTNEAGMSRETRTTVSITNVANVRGLECSGTGGKGWCWQYPRPMRSQVFSVYFLNASTGWTAGRDGEIFKTTDGGASWVRQNSGVADPILVIKFLDASTGWALTAYRSVLRTTDGGANWASAQAGERSMHGIFSDQHAFPEWGPFITAVDAKTVYLTYVDSFTFGAVSTYGSTDGGASWRYIGSEGYAWPANDSPVPRITATGKFWRIKETVDSGNLSVSKEYGVAVSLDGGQSYTTVLSVAASAGSEKLWQKPELVVRDDQHAAVFSRASRLDGTFVVTIYTTVDGGANWSEVVSGDGRWPSSISANGKVLLSGGWVSTNGGATWVADPSLPRPARIQSLGGSSVAGCAPSSVPPDELKFWLSDDDGRSWTELGKLRRCDVLRRIDANTLVSGRGSPVEVSRDNGRTWTLLAPTPSFSYTDDPVITFIDAKNGFKRSGYGSFATKDGGLTWTDWTPPIGVPLLPRFFDKSNGWGLADGGRLYKSTDAGQTWTAIATAGVEKFTRIVFQSATLGWGRTSDGKTVWTRDGGKTWTPISFSGIPYGNEGTTLHLGDQAWVAQTSIGIYVSTDSGGTWHAADIPDSGNWYPAMAFSDSKTGWAVGWGGLSKSEDGGRHWTRVEFPPEDRGALRQVRFVDAKTGWLVGGAGLILATRDGGKTWRRQASGTNKDLIAIEAVDANTAWIATSEGGLLATGNGGN